jgi:hypothetical protein
MQKDYEFKVALADYDAFPHYQIDIHRRGFPKTTLPIYLVDKKDAEKLNKLLIHFLVGKEFLLS